VPHSHFEQVMSPALSLLFKKYAHTLAPNSDELQSYTYLYLRNRCCGNGKTLSIWLGATPFLHHKRTRPPGCNTTSFLTSTTTLSLRSSEYLVLPTFVLNFTLLRARRRLASSTLAAIGTAKGVHKILKDREKC